MPTVDVIVFRGIKFRRYPDAKGRTDRVYWTPGIADRANGCKRLHEEIWIAANGPIPKRRHIHHRDGNPLNNSIENLECVTAKHHSREHWTKERSERSRRWVEKIRPLAAAWHRSPAGKRWHKKNAQTVWEKIRSRKPVLGKCDHCGEPFPKVINKSNWRFCSNNCKSAWRRKSHRDDASRSCALCGKTFVRNRYVKCKTCSRPCAIALTSRTKRGL